ncbi:MAG TPA: Gfo/Idh/MocA family oxidoreductase [Clostridiaceae bacterium]
MERIKVGVIGCGTISGIYLKNLKNDFQAVEVVACTDINMDKARARAAEFGIQKACPINELLSDPEIKIVLNLTIPRVHAEVCIAAIEAGKRIGEPIAATAFMMNHGHEGWHPDPEFYTDVLIGQMVNWHITYWISCRDFMMLPMKKNIIK